MKKTFTITELSSLTNKTRPTLYKYIFCFDNDELDNIPYKFIKLFEMIEDDESKKEIIEYCKLNFTPVDHSNPLEDFISFIKQNQDQIDFEELKEYITKRIKQ